MNYSYGGQFPFQWTNSNPYIQNGFSGANQQPPQAAASAPAGAPPGYPIAPPAPQATQANISSFNNTPVMHPFSLTGPQFQNNNHAPSAPFDGNWNYNYNMPRFPEPGQQQGMVNVVTSSQGKRNTILPVLTVANHGTANVGAPKVNLPCHGKVCGTESGAHENDNNLSQSDFTEKIALKVSTLLTNPNILKNALSKLQTPPSELPDASTTSLPVGVTDEQGNNDSKKDDDANANSVSDLQIKRNTSVG